MTASSQPSAPGGSGADADAVGGSIRHLAQDPAWASRRERLWRAAARESSDLRECAWGRLRAIDGLHLAHFALGDQSAGNALLAEAIDLAERNSREEAAGLVNKWHLGDFVLHPVLRAVWGLTDQVDPILVERAHQLLTGYLYHFGDLSENHNLLHAVLRYLVGGRLPEAIFRDGRSGAVHAAESRATILDWCATWVVDGSSEWGADLYYNVDFLALLNLVDFAPEVDIRQAATALTDLLALDHALDLHAGTANGAARRGYGCYRLSPRTSPARPLCFLWFGAGVDSDSDDGFWFPWFTGGVLIAACSSYRPPEAVRRIAGWTGAVTHGASHARPIGMPGVDIPLHHRVTTRHADAQLSATVISASPSRYTDFTWVASLGRGAGGDANALGNHPHFAKADHNPWDRTPASMVADYDAGMFPGRERPWWVAGNFPPGWADEARPGYWQGHGCSPACWMAGTTALVCYDIGPEPFLPWTHVFLPKAAYDEVITEGHWLFIRRGDGYLAIWSSAEPVWTTTGTWADAEVRFQGRQQGQSITVGWAEQDGDFAGFIARAKATAPAFADGAVSALVEGQRRSLSPTGIAAPQVRLQTPWGGLDHTTGRLHLDVAGAALTHDLGWLTAHRIHG